MISTFAREGITLDAQDGLEECKGKRM